jgi:acyl carrier protein
VNGMTRVEALAMLAEAFNEPLALVTPDALREGLPGWDSMGALMLIAELDERFGIELTAEVSRSMLKVSDALDFLRERGVLTEP